MHTLACIIIIVCLLSLADSQRITAQFTVSASQYNHGYFNGILFYDWSQRAMLFQFPKAGQYAELYIFNSFYGYPGSLTGQFSTQYLYKNSSVCYCETTTLMYAMPPLFPSTSTTPAAWSAPGAYSNFPLGSCKQYSAASLLTASGKAYNLVTTLWAKDDGTPCAFNFTDGRQFTLQSVDTSAISSYRFVPPTNCKCGKPLDLVLSLDRTGSIQYWMWLIQHEFTKNLSLAFDYGPLKTNMGIVDWNSVQWTTIDLTAGISYDAVETAIDNMGCCQAIKSSTDSCCCCGTPIGAGIYIAGQMMLTSTRPTATKVIIVLTDGCQNHMFNAFTTPPTVTACNCATEVACATQASCVADIVTYYNYVTSTIPTVKIIAVGIGDDKTICTGQLLEAAGGISDNVFNPRSWGSLSSFVESISAAACTADDNECPGCCGICSCGTCITPNDCYAPDLCTVAAPDTFSKCCANTPKICTASDACHTSSCNVSVGCVNTPKTCPPGTNCTEFYCDSNGFCKSRFNGNPACNQTVLPPECLANLECDDGNLCTNDYCIHQTCVYNDTVCGQSNACVKFSCNPVTGCSFINTTCNDKNICTKDSCDPITGCQFVPIACNKSSDRCIISKCDPSIGCVNTIDPCSNLTAINCTIVGCVNNTCSRIDVCIPPPPPTGTSDVPIAQILASSIGAAAIVGIAIAAVVIFCAAAGGGAVAFAQAAAVGGTQMVANNPIYCGNHQEKDNPLFKPKH